MGNTKQFYRTTITYVILSERPVDAEDLSSLVLQCDSGDLVGKETSREVDRLSASSAREELIELNSEPGFFGLDLGTDDHQRTRWLEGLSRGDRVEWNDPDDGLCSGRGTIQRIQSDSGDIESTDTIITLQQDDGGEVDVTCAEISPIKDERDIFLSNLGCRDEVKVGLMGFIIIEPIFTAGNPLQWVWRVAPINQAGSIIGPSVEVTGSEIH